MSIMLIVLLTADKTYLGPVKYHEQVVLRDIIVNKVKELRAVDNLLNYIIDDEGKITFKDFLVEGLSLDNITDKEVRLGKYKWSISKTEVYTVLNKRPIFYITERKVILPLVKVNKMIKGLVGDKIITLDLTSEDFDDDLYDDNEDDIKINVISKDDDRWNILSDECGGKLLIFYHEVIAESE